MHQAVFFDAFNTLFSMHRLRDRESHGNIVPMRCERLLHDVDARLQAAYGRARSGQPGDAGLLAKLLAGMADRSGIANTGPVALLRRESIMQRWMAVYSDVVETLQALHGVCHLGIISNGWPYLEALLDMLGLSEYFQSIVISALVGLSKPNPDIFHFALRSLQVSPSEAIFVDDLPKNVWAAQRIGLRSLWLVRNPLPASRIPSEYRALERIESLSQLLPMIQRA